MISFKNLYKIILIFTIFPYVNLVENPADVQPISLVLIFFYFLFSSLLKVNRKVKKNTKLILLTLIISPFPFLINFGDSHTNFDLLRSYIALFSLLIHLLFFSTISHNVNIKRIVKISIHIYLLGALLQSFYPNLVGLFVNRAKHFFYGFGGRGFTSFTPEPTFYGLIVLILMLLYFRNSSKNEFNSKSGIYILLISSFQIIVLAKSSLATIILFFFLLSFFLKKLIKPKFIVAFILTLLFLTNFINENDRIYYLISSLYNEPNLILADGSVNFRISDIYYSHLSLFNKPFGSGGIPWNKYLSNINDNNFLLKSPHSRVSSFSGTIFYTIGVFGLPLIFFLINRLFIISKNYPSRYIYILSFIILLSNSIQISLPTIALILTYETKSNLRFNNL